jgi:hypothetical protein
MVHNVFVIFQVEILELIGTVNFRVVTHLEACCSEVNEISNIVLMFEGFLLIYIDKKYISFPLEY